MTVTVFVDTNILVLAASRRPEEARKKQRALELISSTEFGISAQVVAEFYNVVTRKGDPPMNATQALEWIEQLEEQPCVPVDIPLIKRGIEISQRFQTSYWDGAILAAAEAMRAEILYSEDLNHGQRYGTVRVLNPFRDA